MELLRSLFPFAFTKKEAVSNLVISVIIQVVISVAVGAVFGLVAGLLKDIPLVPWLLGTVGSLVGVYFTASIVLTFLYYFNVIKD